MNNKKVNENPENNDCETKVFCDLMQDLFDYIDESIESAKKELIGSSN